MDEGIEKLDLDDNATKWPDCSKRILDPHDCLGLVAVLWFFAVLGLDTTINHWGLADEHLADEEMMLMAIFLKFLNSLTLLSVLSVSLISRVEKGIPSSFLPTLMVILSERGTTWVFWFRSFSCIGRFLNSQILFVLLTGTLESFFSNRGWATGTEQSLSSVWKRLILQQDDLNRDAIVQKGKQVYEEDQCWWSDHLSTDRVQSLWCTILVLWSWKPFELNLLIGLGQGIMEKKQNSSQIIWLYN